jgi:hypothetical protein
MSAHQRLWAARMAGLQGDHEFALREFIWFHDHALAEDAALYGVRLSFALGYWEELGKAYPAAMRALEAVREKKAEALLRGEGGRDIFHDVVAIDERLGSPASTYRLYVALAEARPELARECGTLALPAIVEARDFKLARQIAPDAEGEIRRQAKRLNSDVAGIKHKRFTRAPQRWAMIRSFIDSVQQQLDITNGSGEQAEAQRLKKLALSLIPDPSLRKEVQFEWGRPARRIARPPYPRWIRRGPRSNSWKNPDR